ncbi:HAD hydrolase-like protein [Rossellomorea vietnamensis]|uniref:HAD hydrolase-like protein n=1 Tax=Rossellomorea aquimaris TaxID=189382 RepID=A0A5D4TXR1_9BACI|nr:HAD hydrolase-like protein [Rossellomorea aquimaris]
MVNIFSNCKKPSIKNFLEQEDVKPEQVLILGDQLMTDILCGNRLGVKTLLQIRPLKKNSSWLKKEIWWIQRRFFQYYLKIL